MKKVAFLFPGQGAQYVGMGKDFFDSFPVARDTFLEADEYLGRHLSKIIFEGPEDLLTQTKNSQVAIFVVSMAILRLIDWKPTVCAGLSLGEYTALCASGRLRFKETLALVQERARLMNEACEKVPGTMAAVLGFDPVEEAIQNIPGVWVANYNAPGQKVISGTKEGVEKASLVLKEKGAKRVLPLTVHGAFHSGLMQSAQEGLAPFVEKANIQISDIGFVMNVPGHFVSDTQEIKRNLTAQVTKSVRWEQGIEALKAFGIDTYIEIGCGKTLTGLNKKMGINTFSVEKVQELEGLYATT